MAQVSTPVRPRSSERRAHGGNPPPPVTLEDRGGDGSNSWVELTVARDDIDAHLLSGRLMEEGIETRGVKDRAAPGAWLYGGSNPWAPVTIMVRKLELNAAKLVLVEMAYEAPAAHPASLAEPARSTERPATRWWVTALALGIVMTALLLAEMGRAVGRCGVPLICKQPSTAAR